MGDDDRREESSSVPEHRIPKGPKADRQEKEDASAVPQQDARTENDGIKDNPQLIPTEPKADRLVKTWQAGTRPVPEQNARPRDDWFKNLYLIPKEPKADRLAKSRQADTKLVPEQDAHIKNDWNKRKQQPIPTEPKADRLAKISANSLSTPSASSDGDDGNLYDPNKTEEEKEKIRQEINEHNRGLLVPPWSGPNLGPEMQDIERG
ncbi:hypothetical protein J4E86_011080 [Alternaria arbusti]|uniref:uncharacterized protein n=1 Tax=Alternaria arbusti TaxID=232088 RepID=UPI00221FF4FE|nr:uncharacterized protein J4E86_011080 [Alternaria arbusti]KAI4940275.1 hypothetical protein J4E86_011080 [Alternaria arbusti]